MLEANPGAQLMIALLACHLAAAVILPWLSSRLGRRVFLLGALPPAATVIWAAWHSSAILAGNAIVEILPWAPAIGFDLRVRVDAFALVMIALVSGIGVLIFAYSRWYLREGPEIGRFAALLAGFGGAMLGLVVADNLIALFLFWELTSITSYLLIGFEDRSATARAAALRALLITAIGGLAMLAGFVLLAGDAGTYTLSELLAAAPRGPAHEIALLLVLFGAFTKSAQAPFHFWLPGAMAAPTPVSAYLHSATMVKAGVYLVARLAPAFYDVSFWQPLVMGVGLATMMIGGWRALAQRDLKLLLAYGTVGQLGILIVLFGAGLPAATLAGTAWILAHGIFKAALFMVTGIVDHQAGSRDLTRLSGLYRPLRAAFIVAAISAASMAGLPPLAGFVAKEAAFGAFDGAPWGAWEWLLPLLLVLGSILTFAYSARFLWGAFAPKDPRDLDPRSVVTEVASPARGFLAPAALLALFTVALGVAPSLWSGLVVSGARSLDPRVLAEPLALWHGFNRALVFSALAIAGGALLWGFRRRVADVQRRFRLPLDGMRLHDRAVAYFLHLADALTGHLQTGSLPMYLVVILSIAIAGPAVFLWKLVNAHREVLIVDRPMQLAVALVMIVAAFVTTRATRRMTAVVASYMVGYGIAFLFVIQGAPDLALTQLLVESMALVLFVLILRHLPTTFRTRGTATWQTMRVLLAIGVGAFAAAAAMVSVTARKQAPVSDEYLKLALPEGHGHNVVNVILVDFRAFDTFGEILVLTVAVLGVIGLIRAAQRDRGAARVPVPRRPYRPSPILDGAVRILFHTMLVVSIVLLVIGHDRPGGGFIGGLVAGAAFTLVYLAGGTPRVRRAEPASPELYLGSGIVLAGTAGVAGWLAGGEFLQALLFSASLPVVGTVEISSVLFFDLGVYLVVVGLVTALLRSAGREETLVS